ncbi:LOB domain-containing protein 1-like [Hibiscus syriacus]|nr:LOB domain-containing protein 1-like [Hibiscus syriacus]
MVEKRNREDAVKALVYEATWRIKDPVYGSTGVVCQLQKMVQELEMQLESTKARVLELQQQKDQFWNFLSNLDLISPINGGNFALDYHDSISYDPAKFPAECDDWII